ncbi:MAG: tetratricopeptide repeat protein [candidate division Zixibacteria bacterium]|nr:tetratricopeptide repeat protein [candidate division Zixibacteria bacterium]
MFCKRRVAATLGIAILGILVSGIAYAQKPEALDSFKRGIQFKNDGSFFQAKAMFEQALKQDPKFHQARVELAAAYLELNQYDKAEEEFAQLKKTKSTLYKYHTYRGLMNYRKGLRVWTDLVKNEFKQYVFKDDGSEKFIAAGSPPEVQIDKQVKKVNQDTTDFEARYRLRGMYYDFAIQELQQGVKENAQDTLAGITLGLVYLERGRPDLAKKQAESLDKIHAMSADVLRREIERLAQAKAELLAEPDEEPKSR